MALERALRIEGPRIGDMSKPLPADDGTVSAAQVTVRYWASIRSAAGLDEESVEAANLADVLVAIASRHPDQKFRNLLGICSVLVDSLPAGSRDPHEIGMRSGAVVEFLPPFAGG